MLAKHNGDSYNSTVPTGRTVVTFSGTTILSVCRTTNGKRYNTVGIHMYVCTCSQGRVNVASSTKCIRLRVRDKIRTNCISLMSKRNASGH